MDRIDRTEQIRRYPDCESYIECLDKHVSGSWDRTPDKDMSCEDCERYRRVEYMGESELLGIERLLRVIGQ